MKKEFKEVPLVNVGIATVNGFLKKVVSGDLSYLNIEAFLAYRDPFVINPNLAKKMATVEQVAEVFSQIQKGLLNTQHLDLLVARKNPFAHEYTVELFSVCSEKKFSVAYPSSLSDEVQVRAVLYQNHIGYSIGDIMQFFLRQDLVDFSYDNHVTNFLRKSEINLPSDAKVCSVSKIQGELYLLELQMDLVVENRFFKKPMLLQELAHSPGAFDYDIVLAFHVD